MLLHIRTKAGKPLIDTPVTFDEPAGPLADSLWPQSFRTDGIGDLRFDGLSSGLHRIHIGTFLYPFIVPDTGPTPVKVLVRLPE